MHRVQVLYPSHVLGYCGWLSKEQSIGMAPSWLVIPLFLPLSEVLTPTSFSCSERQIPLCFRASGLQLGSGRCIPHTSRWDWQRPGSCKTQWGFTDFSNSPDHLWVFILFLLSNFCWFNKKLWYLEIKFREDLSRCWWYQMFAECPLCFISRNCFVNICYILYL